MAARKRKNPQLARCVRIIREMNASGWSIDCIIEVALGPHGLYPAPAEDRPHILALYREAIGEQVSP